MSSILTELNQMIDLSMFSSGTRGTPSGHRDTFGTRGTPALLLGVPQNTVRAPFKIKDLNATGHAGHAGHQKNNVSEKDTESFKEAFEERAAIMEYMGGLQREEAERQAKVICMEEFRRRKQHH